MVPRDLSMEKSIGKAGKIEYILQTELPKHSKDWFPDGFIAEGESSITSDDIRMWELELWRSNGTFSEKTFGISPRQATISLPCMSRYMQAKRVDFKHSLQVLSDTLSGALNQLENTSVELESMGVIEHAYRNQIGPPPCFITDDDGGVLGGVHFLLARGKKLEVPFFQQEHRRHFWIPTRLSSQIVNRHLMKALPDAAVIISDSLEIAIQNQQVLSQSHVRDVVWTSWHGGLGALPKLDLSPLRGRHVFILLTEHSGQGSKQQVEVATRLLSLLDRHQAKFQCAFALFPAPKLSNEPVPFYPRTDPVRLSRNALEKLWQNGGFNPPPHVHLPIEFSTYTRHVRGLNQSRRRCLFEPFLYEKNFSIIHGDPGSGKTFFTLGMAFAVSQGRALFDTWQARKPTSVLFLHADQDDGNIFIEQMRRILMGFVGPDASAVRRAEHVTPTHAPAPFPPLDTHDEDIYLDSMGKSREKCIPRVYYIGIEKASIDLSDYPNLSSVFSHVSQEQAPALLVLDGFGLQTLSGMISTAGFMQFIRKAQEVGTSVVWVMPDENSSKAQLRTIRRSLPVDNEIEIRGDTALEADVVAMSVRLRKSFGKLANEPRLRRLHFSVNADPPEWKVVAKKKPLEEELKSVNRCMKDGYTEKKIAAELGMTLSLVKKRKRQVRERGKKEERQLREKGLL